MAMKKGTGFSKIFDDAFDEYSKNNSIKGKDPTDVFSDIVLVATDIYFEKHPNSTKTDDELIRGSIGDRMFERIKNIAFN